MIAGWRAVWFLPCLKADCDCRLESCLVVAGPEEGCQAMPGLKADCYCRLESCLVSAGPEEGCLAMPGLEADWLPGWRDVWLPSGLKAESHLWVTAAYW